MDNILSWLFSPALAATNTVKNGTSNWLSGIGAQIGSGLESGFIAVLKDFWAAIRPYMYITVGASIIILIAVWYFSGKIITPQTALAAMAVM